MKKALLLTVLTVAVLAMVAVPAFAEGYNDGGYNWTLQGDAGTYGGNAGIYVRNAIGADQISTDKGPHGDYNTTTNKCQDCHSTHYATGSYMLLRANSREDACTFCHAGGGGSSINIQMDNEYDADGVVAYPDGQNMGKGVGHTLGYKGMAPTDIEPAFQDSAGLACFSCHSPHGNSARTLGTATNPGAAMDVFKDADGIMEPWQGVVTDIYTSSLTYKAQPGWIANIKAACEITTGPFDGMYDLNAIPVATLEQGGVWRNVWGKSPVQGNIVVRRGAPGKPTVPGSGVLVGTNDMVADTVGGPEATAFSRPIFPDNKWLLLKNPNPKLATEDMTVFSWERTGFENIAGTRGVPFRGVVTTLSAGDVVPTTAIGFFFAKAGAIDANDAPITAGNVYANARADVVGSALWERDPNRIYLLGHFTEAEVNALAADDAAWVDEASRGVNKIAMDWDFALGPADIWLGPDQDADRNQPYMWSNPANYGNLGTSLGPANNQSRGMSSVFSFCTACHQGAGGASTQPARVYFPDATDNGDAGIVATAAGYIVAYSHDAQPTH